MDEAGEIWSSFCVDIYIAIVLKILLTSMQRQHDVADKINVTSQWAHFVQLDVHTTSDFDQQSPVDVNNMTLEYGIQIMYLTKT